MFLVTSCSCLCPIHWNQVLSKKLKCSWSSADSRCSNYIWVINKFIAYKGATYIRGLPVHQWLSPSIHLVQDCCITIAIAILHKAINILISYKMNRSLSYFLGYICNDRFRSSLEMEFPFYNSLDFIWSRLSVFLISIHRQGILCVTFDEGQHGLLHCNYFAI